MIHDCQMCGYSANHKQILLKPHWINVGAPNLFYDTVYQCKDQLSCIVKQLRDKAMRS